MKKAVEEVDKCRMTLKWTYAMAYYLAKGNEKDLFEDNQRYELFKYIVPDPNPRNCRDLEKAVEDLSELLESPIEPETIPQLRQKVTDKTVSPSPSSRALSFPNANSTNVSRRYTYRIATK